MEEMQVEEKTVMKEMETEVEEGAEIEKSITEAMRLRVGYFKDQADSLTLEGVRRVIEKDLGLDTSALDVHKRFIKQCLQECFDGASDQTTSKTSGETVEEIVNTRKEETPVLSEELQEEKVSTSAVEEKMPASPVQGVLEGDEGSPNKSNEAQSGQTEKGLSKDIIKKALKKRVSYLRANSESINMLRVRRLLEKDLKLDEKTLDPFKKFICLQLDEVLQSSGDDEPANGSADKRLKKDSLSKASMKSSSEESSKSFDSDGEEVDEEEVKPKRKMTSKGKPPTSEGKNRKRPAKETTSSGNKRKKPVEQLSEESDAKDDKTVSEDGHLSSDEKPVKKKREASTQVHGKHVEHLKSVIKSCGMSVPPAVYKRAKQAPESKREAALVKELEEILKREGLSTNPSEKEIKAVKKQKERTKELEGIDLSNIVSSSRRRSASSFIPPPLPKLPVESDNEDNENEDDQEDDDDGSDDEAGESNSEESNDGAGDDSD